MRSKRNYPILSDLHYGSISLITEPCRSAHIAAVKAAKEAGIKSIWNTADFIKVSDDEVEFITQGPADEKNCLSLWYEGLKLLVVTDGDKGCRYFTKSFNGTVKGFAVNTVDTTGAGDAFVGSLLCSLAKDPSLYENEGKLKETLTHANACGAICTTQKGAIPALPDTTAAQKLISGSK